MKNLVKKEGFNTVVYSKGRVKSVPMKDSKVQVCLNILISDDSFDDILEQMQNIKQTLTDIRSYVEDDSWQGTFLSVSGYRDATKEELDVFTSLEAEYIQQEDERKRLEKEANKLEKKAKLEAEKLEYERLKKKFE
jgi:hypothetical protein